MAAALVPSELAEPLLSGSIRVDSAYPEIVAPLTGVCFPLVIATWIALTPQLDLSPSRSSPAETARPRSSERVALVIALLVSAFGVGALLIAVPLSESGLWALFTDPASTVERREATFKLLPSGLVKTIYGHATTVGMPLSVVLLVSRRWFSPPVLDASLRVDLVASILLAGSFSGARSPAACEHRLRLPKIADHQARTVPCSFHQELPRPTRRPTGLS